jgi:hypothetical protein
MSKDNDAVQSILLLNRTQLLASGNWYFSINIWNIETYQLIFTLEADSPVFALLNLKEDHLASCLQNGRINI